MLQIMLISKLEETTIKITIISKFEFYKHKKIGKAMHKCQNAAFWVKIFYKLLSAIM